MGIGLVNIKLFLIYFESNDYGMYAWIISFCALGSIVSFLGTNTELFRRMSLENKLSKKEYLFCLLIVVLASTLFVAVTTYLTAVDYFFTAIMYLLIFILAKILLIFARVKANVILIDFLNTGLLPVGLLFSLLFCQFFENQTIQQLFIIHIIFTLLVLIFLSYLALIKKYFLLIKFSTKSNISKFFKNSFYLWVSSISSLSFSILDIFILGLFAKPALLASYVFITRISSITSIPLGFLVSRFQPQIIQSEECDLSGINKTKLQCVSFILLSMIAFYFSEKLILTYFSGVTDFLYLFYLFSTMYIIRALFFEKIVYVQFVIGIEAYARFSVISTFVVVALCYISAKNFDVLIFSAFVVLGQLSPIIFALLYKRYQSINSISLKGSL